MLSFLRSKSIKEQDDHHQKQLSTPVYDHKPENEIFWKSKIALSQTPQRLVLFSVLSWSDGLFECTLSMKVRSVARVWHKHRERTKKPGCTHIEITNGHTIYIGPVGCSSPRLPLPLRFISCHEFHFCVEILLRSCIFSGAGLKAEQLFMSSLLSSLSSSSSWSLFLLMEPL